MLGWVLKLSGVLCVDKESKGAEWANVDKTMAIAHGNATDPDTGAAVPDCWLRGSEPAEWFQFRAAQGSAAPLSFLHQERQGSGAEDQLGDADPPRAFYPTTKQISIGLLAEGKMFTPQRVYWLVETGEHFNSAAARVCTQLGLMLRGVHRVEHYMDVSAPEEQEHRAALNVCYLAELDPSRSFGDVAAQLGCDPNQFSEPIVFPLRMVSWEQTPVNE